MDAFQNSSYYQYLPVRICNVSSCASSSLGLEPVVDVLACTVWPWIVLSVVLTVLLCHISPGLVLRVFSNPWTTQINWQFGVKAQNYQALNLVLYHQTYPGLISHYSTLTLDHFAWAYIITYGLGWATCIAVLSLIFFQAYSTKYKPLIATTGVAVLVSIGVLVYLVSLPASTQLCWYRYAQATIILGGIARVLGHAFESKVPPTPIIRRQSDMYLFKEVETVPWDKKIVLAIAGVIAEICAGLPLRLFVPMLNVQVSWLCAKLWGAKQDRPDGLDDHEALQVHSQRILRKGWLRGKPSKANLIRTAVKLESPHTRALLPEMWHRVFIVESALLVFVSVAWMNALPHSRVVLLGYSWMLMRLLFAKSLDVRYFYYVVEVAPLCGVLYLLSDLVSDSKVHGLFTSLAEDDVAVSTVVMVMSVCVTHIAFLGLTVPVLETSRRGSIGYIASRSESVFSQSMDESIDQSNEQENKEEDALEQKEGEDDVWEKEEGEGEALQATWRRRVQFSSATRQGGQCSFE
eukprot:scpid52441/ scgid9520/ 